MANKAKREALVRYYMGIAMALKEMNATPPEFRARADKWFEGLPVEIAFASFDLNSKIRSLDVNRLNPSVGEPWFFGQTKRLERFD
ncbi:MAG: hypothetical protein ABI434_15565, partial [Burkholderiaceae bacterium]